MATSYAEQHAADAAAFTALAEAASATDWDRPSPVPEWTARGVVQHLVAWLPGFLERTGAALPAVELGDHPAAAWRQRVADVQRLLETEGEREFSDDMVGTMTVGAAIDRFYTADVWMHSWDLGRALGQHPDLGEERCAAALAGMEAIEPMLRASGQFGTRVDVPATASAQERLVAFIGRDPFWTPMS